MGHRATLRFEAGGAPATGETARGSGLGRRAEPPKARADGQRDGSQYGPGSTRVAIAGARRRPAIAIARHGSHGFASGIEQSAQMRRGWPEDHPPCVHAAQPPEPAGARRRRASLRRVRSRCCNGWAPRRRRARCAGAGRLIASIAPASVTGTGRTATTGAPPAHIEEKRSAPRWPTITTPPQSTGPTRSSTWARSAARQRLHPGRRSPGVSNLRLAGR